MTQWHTFTVEWKPSYIEWSVDGKVVLYMDSNSNEGVRYMNKPQHIMMNFWPPTWSPWGDNFSE